MTGQIGKVSLFLLEVRAASKPCKEEDTPRCQARPSISIVSDPSGRLLFVWPRGALSVKSCLCTTCVGVWREGRGGHAASINGKQSVWRGDVEEIERRKYDDERAVAARSCHHDAVQPLVAPFRYVGEPPQKAEAHDLA